jgi:hypothetical protein
MSGMLIEKDEQTYIIEVAPAPKALKKSKKKLSAKKSPKSANLTLIPTVNAYDDTSSHMTS